MPTAPNRPNRPAGSAPADPPLARDEFGPPDVELPRREAPERIYRTPCSWCGAKIEVRHPQSSGICSGCLKRLYPEDAA